MWFQYLKSKRKTFLVLLVFSIIFLISFFLYHLPVKAVLYPIALSFSIGLIILVLDYRKVKKIHDQLEMMKGWKVESLDCFPLRNNLIEEDYMKLVKGICEQHMEFQHKASREYQDMVDYYTIWAHQIKTPIAAMRLNIQKEDSSFARLIRQDLNRIERYVEMVLTFLRLRAESNDYVIKRYDLDQMVRAVVKRFSSEFIGKHLSLDYQNLDKQVVTDEKWLSFVIEQILSNAVKYTNPGGRISIFVDEGRSALCIKDNGIGIAAEDLPRIFEKGYTGFNGRMDKKASGIGLYLCKQICDKLGHKIWTISKEGEGSTFFIEFSNVTRM